MFQTAVVPVRAGPVWSWCRRAAATAHAPPAGVLPAVPRPLLLSAPPPLWAGHDGRHCPQQQQQQQQQPGEHPGHGRTHRLRTQK